MRRFVVGLAVLAILLIVNQPMARAAEDEKLLFDIHPIKTEYKVGEPFVFEARLTNVSDEEVLVLTKMQPEGWVVYFDIKNSDGYFVYTSPLLVMEMRSGSLKGISLGPGYFYGARYNIKSVNNATRVSDEKYDRPLSPGNYFVHARYSNRKIRGIMARLKIPVALWGSETVEIRITED